MEMTHVLNQETIVEAVLNQDIEKVFRAFLNDPLIIGAALDREDARELFNNMVKNTKKYIPWLK
jgi:galacturan 1,4-alpha-galacturonidase